MFHASGRKQERNDLQQPAGKKNPSGSLPNTDTTY
jgi:hypothetical protein